MLHGVSGERHWVTSRYDPLLLAEIAQAAFLCYVNGRYKQSEELYQRTLICQENDLGENAPETLETVGRALFLALFVALEALNTVGRALFVALFVARETLDRVGCALFLALFLALEILDTVGRALFLGAVSGAGDFGNGRRGTFLALFPAHRTVPFLARVAINYPGLLY